MNLPIEINENLVIPAEQIEISAVRSSGPGGQNVNKVATCIELRFNPGKSGLFSDSVLERLTVIAGNRFDSEGTLIITSQKFREQYRNLDDARNKLKEMILKALKPPRPRRPTRPTKASVEKRITRKKQTSQKKSLRQKRDWD